MTFMWPKKCVVLAKDEMKYYPFVGMYMALAGNIFIQRSQRTCAIETMRHAALLVQQQKVH